MPTSRAGTTRTNGDLPRPRRRTPRTPSPHLRRRISGVLSTLDSKRQETETCPSGLSTSPRLELNGAIPSRRPSHGAEGASIPRPDCFTPGIRRASSALAEALHGRRTSARCTRRVSPTARVPHCRGGCLESAWAMRVLMPQSARWSVAALKLRAIGVDTQLVS